MMYFDSADSCRIVIPGKEQDIDRRWMVVSLDGTVISQIENPQLGLICPTIDKSGHSLCLQAAGLTPLLVPFSATGDTIKCSFTTKYGRSCEAIDQGEDAAKWLSDFIGKPCRLCCTTNSVQTPILDAVKVDTNWRSWITFTVGSVLFTVSFVALVLTIRNKVTQPSLSPYVVTIVGNDEGGYAFLYRSKIQDEVGKQPSIELIHKEDFHRSWAKFKGHSPDSFGEECIVPLLRPLLSKIPKDFHSTTPTLLFFDRSKDKIKDQTDSNHDKAGSDILTLASIFLQDRSPLLHNPGWSEYIHKNKIHSLYWYALNSAVYCWGLGSCDQSNNESTQVGSICEPSVLLNLSEDTLGMTYLKSGVQRAVRKHDSISHDNAPDKMPIANQAQNIHFASTPHVSHIHRLHTFVGSVLMEKKSSTKSEQNVHEKISSDHSAPVTTTTVSSMGFTSAYREYLSFLVASTENKEKQGLVSNSEESKGLLYSPCLPLNYKEDALAYTGYSSVVGTGEFMSCMSLCHQVISASRQCATEKYKGEKKRESLLSCLTGHDESLNCRNDLSDILFIAVSGFTNPYRGSPTFHNLADLKAHAHKVCTDSDHLLSATKRGEACFRATYAFTLLRYGFNAMVNALHKKSKTNAHSLLMIPEPSHQDESANFLSLENLPHHTKLNSHLADTKSVHWSHGAVLSLLAHELWTPKDTSNENVAHLQAGALNVSLCVFGLIFGAFLMARPWELASKYNSSFVQGNRTIESDRVCVKRDVYREKMTSYMDAIDELVGGRRARTRVSRSNHKPFFNGSLPREHSHPQ